MRSYNCEKVVSVVGISKGDVTQLLGVYHEILYLMAGGRELDVIHLDLSKAFNQGASPPMSDQTSAVWRVMLCRTVVRKLPVEEISARCPGWCIF